MNKMNPVFSLRNFRSFGEEGADFELAPITVLTGCNSAGKSSLVKALMLLSNQPKEASWSSRTYDIHRNSPTTELNISTKSLMLGQFNKVINDKSEGQKFEFSYRLWSDCLQEEVIVKRLFVPKKDILNNAKLCHFTIEKTDGTLIYEISDFGELVPNDKENFDTIEENYKRFIAVIDFLWAKADYALFVEEGSEESQNKDGSIENEDITEIVKQHLTTACDNLKKLNIQVECYSKKTIDQWNDHYRNPFNKTQLHTIIEKRLSNEEKEEEKRHSFMSLLVNEVVRPSFTKVSEYINSSSALINRLYSIEDENKMSKALRLWNERISYFRYVLEDGYSILKRPGGFLNKWIKKFHIGDSIEIEGTTEGVGILVYLVKDGKKCLLADEGYGITQLVSLLLQIDNCILLALGPDSDGQYIYPNKMICVEEPEVHLHPKYQSLLADMFVEAYKKYNIRFIIETHSEYLIRKLQVMVADKENTLTPNDVSLNYVEKDECGLSHNRQIKILADGGLSNSFGAGFFDEADTLAIQLFRTKPLLS